MWVYENETAVSTYVVDLKDDRNIADNLPLNFLSVRNDSSLIANVFLNNKKVGSVQAYSADSFVGKDYEIIMIVQPDGNIFGIKNLFLQLGKNEQMSSMPYNPSWNLMEENIDVYADGCDNRVSLSSLNLIEAIKYWVNVQNNLIVQRRLDIQGCASLGSYEITFNSETILSGGTPINGEVLDTKQYKKVIENREFDYSVTDCTILGWMIDLKKREKDISPDYTLIDDIGGAANSYDDNISTNQEIISAADATNNILNVSFPSKDISEVDMAVNITANTHPGYISLQVYLYYAGGWNMIWDIPDTVQFNAKYITTGWTGVTGLKIVQYQFAGTTLTGNIYDLSVFEA